jgi:deoxycytidylate deaminase
MTMIVYNNNMNSHQDYVISIAKSANASGYHFGAVIFDRRNVVSTGWCQEKTHPRQAHYMRWAHSYKRNNTWLHAEMHSLICARTDVTGCDMIVARWAINKVRTSHPCMACWQAITVAGIRRVWYWSEYDNAWVYRNVN